MLIASNLQSANEMFCHRRVERLVIASKGLEYILFTAKPKILLFLLNKKSALSFLYIQFAKTKTQCKTDNKETQSHFPND